MQRLNAETLLSTLVKSTRERRGESQAALAARLREYGMEVHGTGIARLEGGERAIRVDEMFALIRALELDVGQVVASLELLDETPAPRPRTIGDRIQTAKQVSDAAHEMVAALFDELLSDSVVIESVPEPEYEPSDEELQRLHESIPDSGAPDNDDE
jgi:transcriptional regulator with XRE-family HTH domain